MQVLLDDQICDVNAATVGEAIDAAADVAGSNGRMIVEVFVDDAAWTEAELASPDRLTAVADVVRLTTVEPRSFVARSLAQASDALVRADELQRESAERLQEGESAAAMERLDEAIFIWLMVQEAIVKGARLMELDLDGIVVAGTPINDSIRRLNEWLRTVREALSVRDEIDLADTLLYELPDVVSEWRAVLEEIRRRIEGDVSPS